ncbi:MAG: hypothetical protein ABIK96_08200 [bacterium]
MTGRIWTRTGAIGLAMALWAALAVEVPRGVAQPAPGLRIIAHPEVGVDAVDERFVERVYLGKRSRWPDGTTVVPAMLKSGPVQERFVESYLDRSLSRFVNYWRQAVFTGKGVPPQAFAREADLAAFVAATPGAMGFWSGRTPPSGVKILTIE